MRTGGRFFRYSGLILSRRGVVRFFIDIMACRISEGRTAGTTYSVDVAVEEIGVEVMDDFLHRLSGSSDCSVRASEADHLVIVIGEGSSGVADALPHLCRFCQYFCSSLF